MTETSFKRRKERGRSRKTVFLAPLPYPDGPDVGSVEPENWKNAKSKNWISFESQKRQTQIAELRSFHTLSATY
jgi:hypothetical protein